MTLDPEAAREALAAQPTPKITLATLAAATEQQVFDQAARHLLTQKVRSVRLQPDGENTPVYCAYRGDGGLACAAGCFIGDDEYDEQFEGTNWDEVAARTGYHAHTELIGQLQDAHDRGMSELEDLMSVLPNRLRNVASTFGLSYVVVDEMCNG